MASGIGSSPKLRLVAQQDIGKTSLLEMSLLHHSRLQIHAGHADRVLDTVGVHVNEEQLHACSGFLWKTAYPCIVVTSVACR